MRGQDERITAAAKALAMLRFGSDTPWSRDVKDAEVALAASAAVEAREVAALTAECERLRTALREVQEMARRLKIECEAITVDEPLHVMPNLVAIKTGAMRAMIERALRVSESVPAAQEGK